jgi:hypothetical protein
MNFIEAMNLLQQGKLIKHRQASVCYKHEKGIYRLDTSEPMPIMPELVTDNFWEEATAEDVLEIKNKVLNTALEVIEHGLEHCCDSKNVFSVKIKEQVEILKQLQKFV